MKGTAEGGSEFENNRFDLSLNLLWTQMKNNSIGGRPSPAFVTGPEAGSLRGASQPDKYFPKGMGWRANPDTMAVQTLEQELAHLQSKYDQLAKRLIARQLKWRDVIRQKSQQNTELREQRDQLQMVAGMASEAKSKAGQNERLRGILAKAESYIRALQSKSNHSGLDRQKRQVQLRKRCEKLTAELKSMESLCQSLELEKVGLIQRIQRLRVINQRKQEQSYYLLADKKDILNKREQALAEELKEKELRVLEIEIRAEQGDKEKREFESLQQEKESIARQLKKVREKAEKERKERDVLQQKMEKAQQILRGVQAELKELQRRMRQQKNGASSSEAKPQTKIAMLDHQYDELQEQTQEAEQNRLNSQQRLKKAQQKAQQSKQRLQEMQQQMEKAIHHHKEINQGLSSLHRSYLESIYEKLAIKSPPDNIELGELATEIQTLLEQKKK